MWSHYKQYIETLQELKVPTNTCGTFNSSSKEWNYHPFQKDVGASHHLAFNPEGYTTELNLYIKYSLMYYVGTYKHPIKENVKS